MSDTSERQWYILAETRKRGAIGVFEITRYECDAPDKESARDYAFKVLQARGLETRSVAVYERVPTVTVVE